MVGKTYSVLSQQITCAACRRRRTTQIDIHRFVVRLFTMTNYTHHSHRSCFGLQADKVTISSSLIMATRKRVGKERLSFLRLSPAITENTAAIHFPSSSGASNRAWTFPFRARSRRSSVSYTYVPLGLSNGSRMPVPVRAMLDWTAFSYFS